MKILRLIALAFIVIILISPAQASFATIGQIGMKYGLKFVDPAVSNAVNTALCVANPALCIQGMVVGEVVGQAYQEVAKASPEAAQAISAYNQINEIINDGMTVAGEIQLDNNGFIEAGTFQSKDKSTNIDLRNIKVGYDSKNKLNTYTAGKNGGTISFAVKIPGQESVTTFRNLKEGSAIQTDLNGAIKHADITLTEEGKFVIGNNKELVCQKDSRIVYENGVLKVFSESDITYGGRNIKLFDKSISLKGSIAEGNFRVNDVNVNGQISLESDGYLLKSGTLNHNGFILSKNSGNDVFFMNKASIDYDYARAEGYNIDFSKYKITDYFYDQNFYGRYNDYALVSEEGIVLNGNMNAKFTEGNPWLQMKTNSIFEFDLTKGEILFSPTQSSFRLLEDNSKIEFKNGNLDFTFNRESGKDFMNLLAPTDKGIESVQHTVYFNYEAFTIDKNNKLTGSKLKYPLGVETSVNLRQKFEKLKTAASDIAGKVTEKASLIFETSDSSLGPRKVILKDGTVFYELDLPSISVNKIYGKVYANQKLAGPEGVSLYPVRKKYGYDLYYISSVGAPLKMDYGISGQLTDEALSQAITKTFGELVSPGSAIRIVGSQTVLDSTGEPVYSRIIEGKHIWFKK
jgi:hypothetical protein